MKQAAAEIDISLGFDANYAPHAAVVIASVVRHAPGARFRFILLYTGLDKDLRQRIEDLAPNARFVWTEVRESDVPQVAQKKHFSRAAMFRVALEYLAPAECKRLLYLDSDVVVLGDVRDLWASDLEGRPIGAVRDIYQDGVEFSKTWSLPDLGPSPYFNSGVVLIDLEQIRQEKSFTTTLDFAIKHWDVLEFGDQDALNKTFWGRWKPLDPAWNVQRFVKRNEIAQAGWGQTSPALVHFITADKPWTPNVWHPWAWLYWDTLRKTSFSAEVARRHRMDLFQLLRLRLRWWLRRPPARPMKARATG